MNGVQVKGEPVFVVEHEKIVERGRGLINVEEIATEIDQYDTNIDQTPANC